jgi:SAM-dependent methyltransferase
MSETQEKEKPTEFDLYAGDYVELLRDPIRDRFAATNRFFFERKLQVIRGFYKRQDVNTSSLRWLDIGCGQGDLLRMGRPLFASATGCDPSAGMLQACSDLEVRLQPSIERLPFNDESFDFISAICVYHHVSDEQRPALSKEAFRLLRPGGVFCVIEHNPVNPVTRFIVSRAPVDANAHLLSASLSRRLLYGAGGRILETQFFLLFPERIHRRLARVEDWLGALPLAGQYAVFAGRAD